MTDDIIINGIALRVYRNIIDERKPTIIFLHDSLGCITLWRDFPDKLGTATGCNVLVYDRQGYGCSAPFTITTRGNDYMEIEADVLHDLITQCHIADAILFGHSDGGTIALLAAAKYPAMIKAAITEGAHIFVEEVTLEGIRDAAEQYKTDNLKQRLEKYHGDKTDALFRIWTDTWLSDVYQTWNIEHFLPRISCPLLIIQGERDEYGTLAQVAGIVSQVSGPAIEFIIPGIGHTPHKEASALVLEQAAAFINRI